jgi:transcriptional regulator with XRE-family HTH domain
MPGPQFVFTQIIPDYLVLRQTLNLGKSLEQFGAMVDDATRGNVGNWERDKNFPNKKRLKIIADLAGINVSQLLKGSE